jgi:hypothetical protein
MEPTTFQREFGGSPLKRSSTLGVRQWKVDKYGRLIGLYNFIWRPGENLAVCEKKVEEKQSVRYQMALMKYRAESLRTSPPPPRTTEHAPWTDRLLRRNKDQPGVEPFTGSIDEINRAMAELAAQPEITSCSGAEPECLCGFYAYYNRINPGAGAAGIIRGYGKTTIGHMGFRSMKARVLAVHLSERNGKRRSLAGTTTSGLIIRKEQVKQNYPEIQFFENISDMYSEFPPDSPPLYDPNEPDFWTREIEM